MIPGRYHVRHARTPDATVVVDVGTGLRERSRLADDESLAAGVDEAIRWNGRPGRLRIEPDEWEYRAVEVANRSPE